MLEFIKDEYLYFLSTCVSISVRANSFAWKMLSSRVTGKKYNPDSFHMAKFHTVS